MQLIEDVTIDAVCRITCSAVDTEHRNASGILNEPDFLNVVEAHLALEWRWRVALYTLTK